MSSEFQTRTERDSLGDKELPADVYYGIQTARAIENFHISGLTPFPSLVAATIQIKQAAARANSALGAMDRDRFCEPEAVVGAVPERVREVAVKISD